MLNENNEFLTHALEFVKIQAALRPMSADEMTTMVKDVAAGLVQLAGGGSAPVATEKAAPPFTMDPKKAIKESSITCVICGKSGKVLTKSHLAKHDVTPKQYRAICGYRKDQPLAAKELVRGRRKKMAEMRLWERRGSQKASTE